MKIFIRGGIWTNVEDQVLLAAYMKYGGNQWLRIASLLPRKTASQVKARWEEYLDPTLRKTPWTHREDAKLLHIARLMPMQWRTIAQYFGRSAYQCVERYRALVDKAAATPHYEDNDAAVAHEMMPNFETLDAIPDAIELDQDEKEMLAEARARLANTQGKKARRKARERQLDVMRKIVALRKKRELEAAGIILEEKNMWEDEEFELDVLTTHVAKKGKFDTSEDDLTKKERIQRIRKKVDERNRKKEITLNQVKEDLKKEEAKLDLPYDDRHSELIMPAPQIGDQELKNIEFMRHNNTDFFELPRSLSLVRRTKHVEEMWNPEPEFEEEAYKTAAVLHELPRPYPVSTSVLFVDKNESNSDRSEGYDRQEEADRLILEETIRLAYRDAKRFPPSSNHLISFIYPKNDVAEEIFAEFVECPPADLLEAQKMINDEIRGKTPDLDSFEQTWDMLHKNDPPCFDLSQKVTKLEEKVAKLKESYDSRTESSMRTCDNLYRTLNNELVEHHTMSRNKSLYIEIRGIEEKTLKARIEAITINIEKLRREEKELDNEYRRIIQAKKVAARKAALSRPKSHSLIDVYED